MPSQQNKTVSASQSKKERPFEREPIRPSTSKRPLVSKQHKEQNVAESPLVKERAARTSTSKSALIDLTRESSSKVSVYNYSSCGL